MPAVRALVAARPSRRTEAGGEAPYRPVRARRRLRRGREVAAQGPAREAHEVTGAAAVAGAEAARAALRAGQRRQAPASSHSPAAPSTSQARSAGNVAKR